jgi:hypothetical protein
MIFLVRTVYPGVD